MLSGLVSLFVTTRKRHVQFLLLSSSRSRSSRTVCTVRTNRRCSTRAEVIGIAESGTTLTDLKCFGSSGHTSSRVFTPDVQETSDCPLRKRNVDEDLKVAHSQWKGEFATCETRKRTRTVSMMSNFTDRQGAREETRRRDTRAGTTRETRQA